MGPVDQGSWVQDRPRKSFTSVPSAIGKLTSGLPVIHSEIPQCDFWITLGSPAPETISPSRPYPTEAGVEAGWSAVAAPGRDEWAHPAIASIMRPATGIC